MEFEPKIVQIVIGIYWFVLFLKMY